ncbi:MAG: hypothetical protein IH616_15915, partial [Gemmatimonadales bacterium]|nr:hypothetical protein [Gemmatimonadales bacterium]
TQRPSMYAEADKDGIHTWETWDQRELELPATLPLGRRMESRQQSVYLEDELGRPVLALVTTATLATRESSLALSRFTVSDVIRVERDYRLVFPNDSNAVGVTKEIVWYGRGLGPVKSEIGALVPEGQPIPVESITELRGFRSPTRAIGALPSVTALDHDRLVAALVDVPDTGVTGANLLTRRATVLRAKVAPGGPGFMLVAGYLVTNQYGGVPMPSPEGPNGPAPPYDPNRSGLLVIASDAAGRLVTIRPGPLRTQHSLDPLALAFDGSRFWLLGRRRADASLYNGVSDAVDRMFLVRITPEGQMLDDIEQKETAGCGIFPAPDVQLASSGRSVVMAVARQYLEYIPESGQIGPGRHEERSRILWCSYDLDGQLLVDGITPMVAGSNPAIRLTVTEDGAYVVSMSMSNAEGAGVSYAEIALDANGYSLDAAPRMVTGRAPQNFEIPLAQRWPQVTDLGRFADAVPEPGSAANAISGPDFVVIPHLIERPVQLDFNRFGSVLDWSLLIPEQEGW